MATIIESGYPYPEDIQRLGIKNFIFQNHIQWTDGPAIFYVNSNNGPYVTDAIYGGLITNGIFRGAYKLTYNPSQGYIAIAPNNIGYAMRPIEFYNQFSTLANEYTSILGNRSFLPSGGVTRGDPVQGIFGIPPTQTPPQGMQVIPYGGRRKRSRKTKRNNKSRRKRKKSRRY